MSMSKEREGKDSAGLLGVTERLLRGNGGGGCCGDIKIVEVKEEEEEKTEDKVETSNEGD